MLSSGLLVGHDTSRGGKDDKTERSGRQEQVDPRLDLVNLDVESRGDNSGLVQSTVKLDDDLTGSVVIDDLEVTDVSYETETETKDQPQVKRKKQREKTQNEENMKKREREVCSNLKQIADSIETNAAKSY